MSPFTPIDMDSSGLHNATVGSATRETNFLQRLASGVSSSQGSNPDATQPASVSRPVVDPNATQKGRSYSIGYDHSPGGLAHGNGLWNHDCSHNQYSRNYQPSDGREDNGSEGEDSSSWGDSGDSDGEDSSTDGEDSSTDGDDTGSVEDGCAGGGDNSGDGSTSPTRPFRQPNRDNFGSCRERENWADENAPPRRQSSSQNAIQFLQITGKRDILVPLDINALVSDGVLCLVDGRQYNKLKRQHTTMRYAVSYQCSLVGVLTWILY